MRINPNTANSASKSQPSKPAEHVISDPAFSFFAQIDQIQKLQDDRNSRPDASSRDKNPDKDGDLSLLSALQATMSLPLEPFPPPDQLEHPVDSPANELCGSSGDGGTVMNSLFAAAAAQSMVSGSFTALLSSQLQNSKDSQTQMQSPSQTFAASIPPARNDGPSGLPGLADGIELTLVPGGPAADETDGQNPSLQLLSDQDSRALEETMDRFGTPAVEKNNSPQLPDRIARILEKTMDLTGAPVADGTNGQNPSLQLLSNQNERVLEKTMDRFGAPAAEQNSSPQLLANGTAQTLKKIANSSSSPAEKNTIPELGIRPQSDRQKTRASGTRQPVSIPTDSEMRAPVSKIATIPAPEKSGNSVNSNETAEARDMRGESYRTAAPIKANAPAAPQNDGGPGSQKDSHSRPNEPGAATAAHGKLDAVQTEIPLAKKATNVNRQEVFSRTVSTNAPSVDSTLRPGSSSAPEPARPQNLIFQIAERIQIQVRDGRGEIRIQLKPDGIGQLEIKAETTVNGVTARISTDSDGLKSYLENNLHLLQQTMQDQGLKVDRVYVTVQTGTDDQSSSSHTAQFGHAGQGQHGKETHKPHREPQADGSGVLEEMAVDPATWLMLKPNTRFYTVA